MSTYDVVIKKVPALRVASIRDTIPAYSQQGHLWGELYAYLGQQRIQMNGPCLTLYHDKEYKERDVDAEVCQPVDTTARGTERIKINELPAVETMASVVHHGAFTEFNNVYQALLKWIQENGYRICGPDREIYIKTGEPLRQDDPSYVTEIQIPVEKA